MALSGAIYVVRAARIQRKSLEILTVQFVSAPEREKKPQGRKDDVIFCD